MKFLLAILEQICGDDYAASRDDLADWAMFV
jgi:hypothetical protein